MTESDGESVSQDSLREALKRLTDLQDVIHEVDGTVPPWVTAARQAVRNELRGETDG